MLALLLIIPLALALPKSHESRHSHPKGWRPHTAPSPSHPLPLRIALTQSNLQLGASHLEVISNPDSPEYGHHWTPEKVAEFFAPSTESVSAVIAWLIEGGVEESRLELSKSKGWLSVHNATVQEAERLLSTTYSFYTHVSGASHLACSDYSLPPSVSPHVDFITPTIHYDFQLPPPSKRGLKREKRAKGMPPAAQLGLPDSASLPKMDLGGLFTIFDQLTHCADQITPDCLRAMYGIPPAGIRLSTSKNSLGVLEFAPQAYLPADLDIWFRKFLPWAVGSRPQFAGIDGGNLDPRSVGLQYNGESDLDLEYTMGFVWPLKPVLYQIGDSYLSGSFNNFLDAIDASYCTYLGGDDPTQDSIYPDTDNPDGYQGTNQCGAFQATKVMSVSYYTCVANVLPVTPMLTPSQYMKLGLQGVTLLFSTGDSGVASGYGVCSEDGQYSSTGTRFVPSFPATCPYVTGVGATQLPEGGSVFSKEVAVESKVYSSGGFSDIFALPSYQSKAVQSYYAKYAPPYTAAQYNNSQAVRGFPDISANGLNYVVAASGNFTLGSGTSAATPVVASIFTLINDERLAIGKGPVGFVNPALYANPWMLNDIISGNNPGCGTDGFAAVPGWDPVTGLGTPNYPAMLAYFLLH
ncbi:subtilisin-like protein [Dacryopinax primogenitus]|uniref:tripeptidyl-peptidase II n=1 Tax=Dacryopinax primogenitus (strain DJM 731) TaxID=1858805 RepID=M5GCJ0_DACPD|nr:subtilisin-like protein [Dacryopinax primogenitus]EJU01803.1 subtilisin-like protein [Dacryopinax primogenitus]